MKKVYVETYGCQMNVYDTRAILDELQTSRYEAVETPDDADLVLLNTCAVRDNAEQRVMGRIGELMRYKREGMVMGIVGCMAQRLGKTLREQRKAVDLVVGTDNYGRIAELVEGVLSDGQPRFDVSADGHTTYQAQPEAAPLNNSHFISITRGCDYRCTFCVVPNTRGALRSKDPQQIVREVEAAVAAGGVEVTLLGQNVTAYRHPRASFAGLLRQIAGVRGLRRIRFLTNHPTDFTEDTLAAIAEEPKVSPWLHMPIQSGSDRILRRMKRGYRMDDYMQLVSRARQLLPDVAFSTDVIVGFPGETDAEFDMTLDAMREVEYDSAFTFKYSERPETPAARLDDDVPEDLKNQRLYALNALQEELWQKRAKTMVGQRWEMAVEGDDPKGLGYRKGRTLNNRKVLVPDRGDLNVGDELLVRVTGVRATTFYAEPIGLLWKCDRVDR